MKTRRPFRALIGAGTAAALVGAGLAAATVTASGAPGDSAACPAAFVPGPDNTLPTGLTVNGLTTAGTYTRSGAIVSSPETPEAFTGTYLDTIEDATGDLFIFKLEGSRITNADGSIDAGIWQGISGSPVYDDATGDLVGSVSYSFTGLAGSTYAGITPAADLYALLDETAAPPAARMKLDRTERRTLQRLGMPAQVAANGATRLTTPVSVSGLRGMSPKTVAAIARKSGMKATPLMAGGTGTQNRSVPIVPGGNLAVAASYGSVALFSVGTATAVCDDVVIGYGHPDQWAPATATIHGASTAIISADGGMSFKMANLAAPEGTLLHDRLAGITGRVDGVLPDATKVTVTSVGPRGTGTTESMVSNPDALSFVVATQLVRDASVALDEQAPGSAAVSWEITFTRAGGKVQTFKRTQRYASSDLLPDEVPSDVAGDVETILDNGFEDVTITDVKVTQDLSRTYRAYTVGNVQTKIGGAWRNTGNGSMLLVKPGKLVKVRVHLKRSDRKSKATPVAKTFTFKTSKKAFGRASLEITGNGMSFWDFEEDFFSDFGDFGPEGPEPTSLDEVLAALASPGQDSVDVTFSGMDRRRGLTTATRNWKPGAVVTGSVSLGVKFAKLKTKKAKKPRQLPRR